MAEIKTDKPTQTQEHGWTDEPIEVGKNVETVEGEPEETEEELQLGECRKHPATPVPILSKDGKKQIGTEMFGGIKSVVVYEFPQCVGIECSSDWCEEHSCCINVCKHDHPDRVEYYEEDPRP